MERTFDMLNSVYQPICEYVKTLSAALKELEYVFEWRFFNNHAILKDGRWLREHYPIPVVTVKDICDIGIDIDHIFVECKLKREEAIQFDWNTISGYTFSIYGVDDYLSDFYHASLGLETIPQKISESAEKEIAIAFEFAYLEDQRSILEMIKKLEHIGTYIL